KPIDLKNDGYNPKDDRHGMVVPAISLATTFEYDDVDKHRRAKIGGRQAPKNYIAIILSQCAPNNQKLL
ncbi:unnamed protein product, partial [Allacma fusca]